MQQIPVFIEKDRPLFKLHYGLLAALHLGLLLLALMFNHPIYLLSLLVAIVVIMMASDTLSNWWAYLRMAIPLVIFIVLLNVLFSRAGSTLIFPNPMGAGGYTLPFTWEALAYGGSMALRLLVIISACASFFALVSPAKTLRLLGLFGQRWAFTFNLSLRLIPLMLEEYHRIAEVQRCRGVEWTSGGLLERIKSFLPICSVLLLTSLERSVEMAESMYGRGFGSGKRSNYYRETWQNKDTLVLLNLLALGILSGAVMVLGWGEYSYYPQLTAIDWMEMGPVPIIWLLLVIPCLGKGGESDGSTDEFAKGELYLSGKPTP
ncbi:MAG: energy-coupling factor transporter transmembrane component T [Syntrophomonadaceae bacterium]